MDAIDDIAASVLATLEGAPYVADDVQRIARAIRLAVEEERERCAKLAEFGDCETGMGCARGFDSGSIFAAGRKAAADDIRKLGNV